MNTWWGANPPAPARVALAASDATPPCPNLACHLDDPADSSPFHPPAQFRSGVLLAAVGTFLFALKSIFIKLTFAYDVTPAALLLLRLWFSLPLYVAVLWWIRRRANSLPLSQGMVLRAVGLGFLGYYLASYLDLSGLAYISAQLERLTLFTYPTLVALLAWMFLGEQLTPRILMAIALSYAGLWVMYGQEKLITASGASSNQLGWGVLLVLGSALSYSLYVLFAKPTIQRIGSLQFTSLAMIGSTVFATIHYALSEPATELAAFPPAVYAYALVLAMVCTVLPSFMINEAIARIGATRTTVIGTVGPVLTMLLAVLILHETTSIYHFAGMLIAVLGVSLVAVK